MPLKKDLWIKYHLNFPIEGGYGTSIEDAITILLENNLGILLEKDIIACMHCEAKYEFQLLEQKVVKIKNEYFDVLKIKFADNEIKEVFFNISSFFGKVFKDFTRNDPEYIELLKTLLIRPDSNEEMSWFR